MLLPNTQAGSAAGMEGALVTAQRMRLAVAQMPLPAPVARLTASVGVAMFPDTAADAGELVSQADAALYKAKSDGKDRVVVFSVD